MRTLDVTGHVKRAIVECQQLQEKNLTTYTKLFPFEEKIVSQVVYISESIYIWIIVVV